MLSRSVAATKACDSISQVLCGFVVELTLFRNQTGLLFKWCEMVACATGRTMGVDQALLVSIAV